MGKFLAPPNRKSMGESGSLMIFLYLNYEVNEAENRKGLSCIDPLTVDFFQNNWMSSISIILLTNGRTKPRDGRNPGRTDKGSRF